MYIKNLQKHTNYISSTNVDIVIVAPLLVHDESLDTDRDHNNEADGARQQYASKSHISICYEAAYIKNTYK